MRFALYRSLPLAEEPQNNSLERTEDRRSAQGRYAASAGQQTLRAKATVSVFRNRDSHD